MLRLLFANSSSYTELVCIASLLQRKANWQEKKGLFLASFPHLHSRRQSCFKPSSYPQFITVMTIVKGKAKNTFWTGLTGKEGGFCQKDCTETCESPMGVQRVLMSLLLLSKGTAFFAQWAGAIPTLHTCWMPAPSPSSTVGTALPPGHRAGTLPPPLWWGGRPFTAPLPPHHCAPPSSRARASSSHSRSRIAMRWLLPRKKSPGQRHRRWWYEGHSCNLALCKSRLLNLSG